MNPMHFSDNHALSSPQRLYHPTAFATDQPAKSYWQVSGSCSDDLYLPLDGEVTTDIAVIGGGYTGLSAAYQLASHHHVETHLVEAGPIGFGASGRNAGFCCLASSTDDIVDLLKRFGEEATREFLTLQYKAVNDVDALLRHHAIDTERYGVGEVELYHRSDFLKLSQCACQLKQWLNIDAMTLSSATLADQGIKGPEFSGGLHIPFGFGLNPLRYLQALVNLAVDSGVKIYPLSPVIDWSWSKGYHHLRTPQGCLRAHRVIVATNGYSSENLPPWLGGRLLPVLSHIVVTRPLSLDEQQAQGWTSEAMGYIDHIPFHYFRLLPGGRFLFGSRSCNTDASPEGLCLSHERLKRSFYRLFPAWQGVEFEYQWSGFVAYSRRSVPFIGPLPDPPGVYAALAYQGNGLALSGWAGRAVADRLIGKSVMIPRIMWGPLARYRLPSMRLPLFRFSHLTSFLKDHLRSLKAR